MTLTKQLLSALEESSYSSIRDNYSLTPFTPIIGTESRIKNSEPTKGCLWFAKDSKKIYYSDGESFLSMGGNSGVYYSKADIVGEDTSTDRKDFDFKILDIDGNEAVTDGNYKIPNVDDLILNEYTKSFYRVVRVIKDEVNLLENTIIGTEKIAVAGGGGSGGGGGGSTVFKFKDLDDGSTTKYFTLDAKEAKLKFNISSTIMTDNGIVEMVIYVGQNEVYRNIDFQEFQDFEFNLLPYIPNMSKTQATAVRIKVNDLFGTEKNFYYYINVLELVLSTDITDTILTARNNRIDYHSTPKGGGALKDRQIEYRFYDQNGIRIPEKDQFDVVSSINVEIPVSLEFPGVGVYRLEVQYKGRIDGTDKWVYSNILPYSVVSYDEKPLLVAFIPTYDVEQYSVLNITYMIAADIATNDLAQIILRKNDQSSIKQVEYNKINSWMVDFDTIGTYNLSIEDTYGNKISFLNVQVYQYEGEVPTIDSSKTLLYLSATGRSNDEILSSNTSISQRDKWTFGNYTCDFKNFSWGNVNGWLRDEDNISMLRLNSGAELTVNFEPFANNVIALNDINGGLTIELDFKVSGVTDFSQPLISCISRDGTEENKIQVGFQITGQESTMNTEKIVATGGTIQEGDDDNIQKYNTAIQGLTAKFIEGKRIHLSWVIERNNVSYPMIHTYLNGIRSGITFYEKSDVMNQNKNDPAKIKINSTYANIDLYNIRVYKRPLSASEILDNYIATCGTIEERVEKNSSNKGLLGLENEISVESIESGSYKLSVPYFKITGGKGIGRDEETGVFSFNKEDTEVRLPQGKKDYRLINELVFVDQNGKHSNYTLKTAHKVNPVTDELTNFISMYGQGTSSMEYPVKNLRIKSRMKDANNKKIKFTVNENDCPVDLVCLKADYMESSGSHNTGTANLIYSLLTGLKYKTPAQEYYSSKVDYEIVTTIRGYPVLIFYRPDENSVYEFIGKYNLNLDKATQEPFGFVNDPEDKPSNINEAKFGWALAEKTSTSFPEQGIVNTIHCYEFLNNASELANFINKSGKSFEEFFFDVTTDSESGDSAPNWYHSFESRFPESEDETEQGRDVDIQSWFELCKWVNSTCTDEATNNDIKPCILDGKEYTKDTKEYRLAKFKEEFTDHFDLNFSAFYYVLTHVLLMIDSRAKNLMIATWDNKIWYPIFYDMDTMLGLNNYGYNKFGYDIEDTDVNIYNGQQSVLWNNFRECFGNKIRSTYNDMQKNGLSYQNIINNYNNNQADATNESVYNADSDYKYIRPFNEGYYDGLIKDWVSPGSKDYLYAAQGNRSMHREWWVNNRMTYFNGKYLSDEFKNDKYEMRLYTPKPGESYYIPQYGLTKEEFDNNRQIIKYYIEIQEGIYEEASSEFNKDVQYFILYSSSEKLDNSIVAVPPNNSFTLTPLNNQYLSVAYGGDNGVTTSPTFAEANKSITIPVPSGSEFNDTETYVYGGSTLKNLGDLSAQYLGAFKFPAKKTKLEILILGNKNNKYYNYNFSNLAIGESAPYLKTLDITNCSGLSGRSQDVSKCQNIQYIYATGTGLTGVSLPEHGFIKELRLPDTIRSLYLVDQQHLDDEHFTVGSYNFDSNTYTENNYSNILHLQLEDVPQLNSYYIVKGATALQDFSLKNVKWDITNSPEEIDLDKSTIKVLEFLQGKDYLNNGNNIISLTGTLKLPEYVNEEGNLLKLYDKYWRIYPSLDLVFTNQNIYNVNVYDYNDNLIWTKKIKKGEHLSRDFFINGPKGTFTTPHMEDTNEWTYEFINHWDITDINGNLETSFEGSTQETTKGWPINETLRVEKDINLKARFNKNKRKYIVTYKNQDESLLIESQSYDYGTPIFNTLPNLIPYQSDEDLEFDKTYRFIGYHTEKTARTPLKFDDSYQVSYNITLYAIFEKDVSVYDNVHEDYFDYIETSYASGSHADYDYDNYSIEGVYAIPKKDLQLKGKITIPAYYNNKPVIGLGALNGNNTEGEFKSRGCQPTHIFFEKGSLITYVGAYYFLGCTTLKYFEFLDSLRIIGVSAFQRVPLTNYNISSKNLKRIDKSAFQQAFSSNEPVDLFLSSSVVRLDGYAISNNTGLKFGSKLYIGSKDDKSNLVFSQNFNRYSSNNAPEGRIRQNADSGISQIYFYTDNYTADQIDNYDGNNYPIYQNNKEEDIFLRDVIGLQNIEIIIE